jgi:hypothetical protein
MQTRRPRRLRLSTELTLDRFAATMPGVDVRTIKEDLGRHDLLRRTHYRTRWRVRQSTAKQLFEEKPADRTGKMDIFPTEAGRAKLWELYEAGELTMKSGHISPAGHTGRPSSADKPQRGFLNP